MLFKKRGFDSGRKGKGEEIISQFEIETFFSRGKGVENIPESAMKADFRDIYNFFLLPVSMWSESRFCYSDHKNV
jgi:hypothetical protein